MSGELRTGNLFADLPDATAEEQFETLFGGGEFRLVRIVSAGQASPEGFWYDQPEAEWVVVLRGRAGLLIEGETAPRALAEGDYLLIPPRVRHRVAWTDPDEPTVWLALHAVVRAPLRTAGRP